MEDIGGSTLQTTTYTLLTTVVIKPSPTTSKIDVEDKKYSENYSRDTTTSFTITKINNTTMSITQLDSTKALLTSSKATSSKNIHFMPTSTTKLISSGKITTTLSHFMGSTEANIAIINTTSIKITAIFDALF